MKGLAVTGDLGSLYLGRQHPISPANISLYLPTEVDLDGQSPTPRRPNLYQGPSMDKFRILPDWSQMSVYTISAMLSIPG